MTDFNLHTHTWRCRHAGGRDLEYAESAAAAGLKVLGFSDHCPFDGIVGASDRMDPGQKQEYLDSISELARRFEGQLQILTGFEFEFLEERKVELQALRKQCDYMILGQHYRTLPGEDFAVISDDQAVLAFGRQVVQGIQSGLACIVAHPDYFMLGRDHWSAACEETAWQICEASKASGIPLEINLNGIRYGQRRYQEGWRYPYPWKEFWDIARRLHCRVVFGMDAHQPEQLQLIQARTEQISQWISLEGLEVISLWQTFIQSAEVRQ